MVVMLYYYSKRSHGEEFELVEKPAHSDGIWYHVLEATTKDVDTLTSSLELDSNILRDVLDEHELPRVEYDEKNNIYLFMRSARLGRAHTVKTAPFLIVATKSSFVTLSKAGSGIDPNIVASRRLRVRTSDSLTLLFLTVASTVSEYEELLAKTSTFITNIKGRLRSRMADNEDFLKFISINSYKDTF